MSYLKDKFIKLFFIVSVFLILFFILPGFASANTYYWVGNTNGASINSAGNWNTTDVACKSGGNGSVPTSNDTAIFHTCHNSATIDVGWSITSLTMQTGYSGTITNNSGVTTTISNILTTITGGTFVNDGTLTMTATASNKLTGSGTFTNANNSILNYAGSTITVNTFDPSGTGNIVDYDSTTTDQTIHSGTYDSLTINKGTYTATLGGNTTVAGNLNIVSGTLNLSTYNFTNYGTTEIGTSSSVGILNDSSDTGTNIFAGIITNSAGTWESTGNSDYTMNGGIVNNGTFNGGNGTYTFRGANSSLSGGHGYSFGGTVSVPYGAILSNTVSTTVTGLAISGTFNNYGIVNASASGSVAWDNLNLANVNIGSSISSVAISSNGKKIVTIDVNGLIYTSTDSGANWSKHSLSFTGLGTGSCSVNNSSDGKKIAVACIFSSDDTTIYIATSTDSGANWVTPLAISCNGGDDCESAVISPNGTQLAVIDINDDTGTIYVSTDSGSSWFRQNVKQLNNFSSVSMSSDASKLIAVDNDRNIWTAKYSGGIWFWSDIVPGGTLSINNGNGRLTTAVFSAAISSDGRQIAIDGISEFSSPSTVYISTDSGANWTDLGGFYSSIAISADGTQLAASDTSHNVWTLKTTSAGKFVNGLNGTLNYSGSSINVNLVATATGNTVEYDSGDSTVLGTTYYNLKTNPLSGSPTVTLGGNTIVKGDMTIMQGLFDVSTANYTLTVGGNWFAPANANTIGSFVAENGTVIFTKGTHTITGNTIDVGGYHYSNVFYNLTIEAGSTLTFPTVLPTEIIHSFTANGNSSNLITINSSSPSTAAILSMVVGGTVTCDYLSLTDSIATGGAVWNAGAHSTIGADVSGWNSSPASFTITLSPSSGNVSLGNPIEFISNSAAGMHLWVCKTNDWNAGTNSCPDEWCDYYSASPDVSCNYTIQSGDGTGLKYYYAYAVDSNGNPSVGNPQHGTFFIPSSNSSLKFSGKLNIGGSLIIK